MFPKAFKVGLTGFEPATSTPPELKGLSAKSSMSLYLGEYVPASSPQFTLSMCIWSKLCTSFGFSWPALESLEIAHSNLIKTNDASGKLRGLISAVLCNQRTTLLGSDSYIARKSRLIVASLIALRIFVGSENPA